MTSVEALRRDARERGGELVVRVGRPEEVWPELLRQTGEGGVVYAQAHVAHEELEIEGRVAEALQKSGAGSLAYIIGLSVLLYLVGFPLRRVHWRYLDILTFVGITAAPGALYAIPI